ncbi:MULTISPECIES: mechanosensitive ion channel family protein [unclassified Halobacteriovorax]|uniref:mechanosensitive ion channel family protein n=1 Tax=unclassified Halobacteriovorax TaxID=2639665 RepID=UPI002FF1F2C8
MMDLKNLVVSYLYPITVTLLFLGGYFFVLLNIKRVERKKLRGIKRRDIIDAVETDSPVDDQEKELKSQGAEGIEGRFSFMTRALPILIFILWSIFVSIPYLGKIPTVYVSLIAAIVSVIAGFSLRPFLENLFAGVIISFFKSIKIGDTVTIDDNYGIIEEIGLTYSVVKKWNWIRVVIPNSKLLQKEILNYTINDSFVWTHISFFIAPGTDLERVKEIGTMAAKKSSYYCDVEDPTMWVMNLEKDAVECWLAAWAENPSEAWELRNDMRTMLYAEFQREGIDFHKFNISKQER